MRWKYRLCAVALALMTFWINGCGQGPQTASANTGSNTLADNTLTPFMSQTNGSSLDLTNLKVGDRLLIDVRGNENVNVLQSTTTDCECNWVITPTTAGTIQKSDSCLATLTLDDNGSADLTVVRRCGFELDTFRQEINIAAVGIAVSAADKVIADAGSDITVREGDTVTLDGSRSKGPDRAPVVFTWTQTDGPTVSLNNDTTATPSFNAPFTDNEFEMTFALTLSDGNRRDTDEVTIRVTPFVEAFGNLQISAGNDQFVLSGTEVTLEGDTAGVSSANVRWTQVSGPTVTLIDSTTSIARFIAPPVADASATLEFEFSARTTTATAVDTTKIIVESVTEAAASDDELLDLDLDENPDDSDDNEPDDSDEPDGDEDVDDDPDSEDETLNPDAPVVLDQSLTIGINSQTVITLRVSPAGGAVEQFAIDVDPCNGVLGQVATISPTAGRVLYVPNPGFRGIDRLNYIARNDAGESQPATVTIIVGSPRNMRAIWSNEEIDELVDENGNGILPDLLEAGVKDFVIKLNTYDDPIHWSTRLRIERWAAHLHGTDAKLWPIFNFYAENDTGLTPFLEPYVNSDGQVFPNTPCPTDADFWLRAVTDRMLHMVELAGANPEYDNPIPLLDETIGGIIFDVELYASEVRRWDTACYCHQCFATFFAVQGITAPVPSNPAARHPYLIANGLVEDYEDYERTTIRNLAADTREAVHAVAPCMTIGGTALIRDFPHYRGISQGLGSKRMPFVEMTQQQFLDGFNDGVAAMQNFIQAEGIHTDLVIGLWFRFFPPDMLEDHYYVSAVETGGVWLNRTASFEDPDNLCESVNDYYDALGRANAELDRYEANPNHVSHYDATPFAPACFEAEEYEVEQSLVQVEPGPAVQTGMWIRRETSYSFDVSVGESISLDVEFRRIGSNDFGDGWWILLGPNSEQLESGSLVQGQLSRIRHSATMSGIYSLVVNASFLHAFRINNASHPGSYQRIGDNPRVHTWKGAFEGEPQLYAYVPAGESDFHISAFAANGEPTQVIVRDSRLPSLPLVDQIIGDASEGTELIDRDVVLPIANNNGTVIEIVLRNPGGSEDLEIHLSGGAMPYVSQTRSGLLRRP